MSVWKTSSNEKSKKFRNIEQAVDVRISFLIWLKFFWGRLTQSKFTEIPNDHVLSRSKVIEQFTSVHGDSITWIGHACFLIRLEGKTILTDPFLSDLAGSWGVGPRRYVAPAMSVEELPMIDYIVLSHNHYDSLDVKTLKQLPNKNHTCVIAPLKTGHYFQNIGFTNVHELDWEQTFTQNNIEFTALPAIHFSRRTLMDYNQTLWAGFAIKSPNYRIFFSGDTAYGAIFKNIHRRYGPFDLAIVGIGSYEPQAIMRHVHTTPEEAVKIGKDIQAKNILGMHWGTIILSEEPPFEAPARFKTAAENAGYSSDKMWIFKIGETRKLLS